MHTFFRLFNFFEKKKKENFQKFSLQKTQFLTYIILKSIESMENPLRIQASYPWFSLCPEFIFSSCSLARFVYRSRVGQAKEAERFKWTRNQASWKRDVRMENLEWTEISAARDNRRRQYFNRRQIYRPREMANASNVPFRRSYPLLLASFPLTGGVIRRNKPTLRGEIIQERGTLSLSLSGDWFVTNQP